MVSRCLRRAPACSVVFAAAKRRSAASVSSPKGRVPASACRTAASKCSSAEREKPTIGSRAP
eukprot:8951409-Lingulodinium_polyedra.AAC.1